MKTPEKNQLLTDILEGDDPKGFRDATLAVGLNAVRKRVRHRRQFQAAIFIVPLLLLAVRLQFAPKPPAPREMAQAPRPVEHTTGVKYITEKELLALFPNRPIALIGKPGNQQFILLDELPSKQVQ